VTATHGRGDVAELFRKFCGEASEDLDKERQRRAIEGTPNRADAIKPRYTAITSKIAEGHYKAEVTGTLPAPMRELVAYGPNPKAATRNLHWAFCIELTKHKIVGSHERAQRIAAETEFSYIELDEPIIKADEQA
jgi:hypothetical protein